jgi:aryl-alcohol dehydrogenase-like predicted oxidoreductase
VKYRKVPSAGLSLSEVGFGCGGNAGLMTKGSAEEQRRVVARALELGINYFDTAPDYGGGIAEANLGRLMRDLKFRPILTSKVEVRKADLGDVSGHVVRSAEASLARLGVDCLDFLQIHNGPAASAPALEGRGYAQLWIEDFLKAGGALDGLTRLVRDGKARAIGFVCRGEDAAEVRRLLETGAFHLLNVHYSLLNPTAGAPKPEGLQVDRDYGGVLDDAAAKGVGTAIYSALASGALTDQAVAGTPRHPLSGSGNQEAGALGRAAQRAAALKFLSHPGRTLAQAAFRFPLMHPGVTTVLGGFSSLEQLEELATVPDQAPVEPTEMAKTAAVWRTNFGT